MQCNDTQLISAVHLFSHAQGQLYYSLNNGDILKTILNMVMNFKVQEVNFSTLLQVSALKPEF